MPLLRALIVFCVDPHAFGVDPHALLFGTEK